MSWWACAALAVVVQLAATVPVSGTGAIVGHTDAEGALAIWSGWDETGCVIGLTIVGAADYRLSGPPGAPETGSYVGASIIRSDFCARELLMFAEGFAFLAEDSFAVAGDIASASLDAVIPMWDSITGDSFELHADIDVVGGEAVLRIASTEMIFFSPGELSRERTEERVRPGGATGSAIGGDGFDFTEIPFAYAELYEGGLKHVGTPGSGNAMVDSLVAATLAGEVVSMGSGSQGRSAHATWTSMDGTECLRRTVRLVGAESMSDPGQGSRPQWYGMAHVSVLDVCAGRFVSYATSVVDPERGAFTMYGTERAALDHTFEAYDWVQDRFVGIAVDVAWVRDGDVVRDMDFYDVHFIQDDGVFVMHNKQFGSDAWAVAQGSVRLDGVEQAPGPTDHAWLWHARSIQV